MENDADKKTTCNVDDHNDNTGNGLTADKFAGTVHCSVEFRLTGNLFSSFFGGILINEPGIEVGVYGHLLAWHGVQSETCSDLGNSSRTFGDNNKVDKDHDQKDNHAHGNTAANNKIPKRLDNPADCPRAFMAVQENKAGRSNIKG